MRLSDNFLLSEIFGDEPASDLQKQTAKRLALTILQPIRDKLGRPIDIGSGYRSPAHNKKIGGSPTSEHTWQDDSGAVDISIPDDMERIEVLQFIMDKMYYSIGQCIWYVETNHLHISIAGRKQSDFLVCTSKRNHRYMRIAHSGDVAQYDERLT
jgi:uncharacterized protein YcbK (DUF882 family)